MGESMNRKTYKDVAELSPIVPTQEYYYDIILWNKEVAGVSV